jgi:hypothetical protein
MRLIYSSKGLKNNNKDYWHTTSSQLDKAQKIYFMLELQFRIESIVDLQKNS